MIGNNLDTKKIIKDQNHPLDHLQLYFYLVPVFGVIPAVWTLYSRTGTPKQNATSRLAISLALFWLLGSTLILTGTLVDNQILTLRLLFIYSMLTSGYFLVNLGLMIRVWRRSSVRLPGFTELSETIIRHHLDRK